MIFDAEGIKIDCKLKGRKYTLDELKGLKIYWNSYSFNKEYDWEKFSNIRFEYDNKKYLYHFNCPRNKYLKLCDFLYNQGVNFKEYKNENRVFKGNKLSYNEIQKIKESYKIDW